MTGRVLPFDASAHAAADALLPFYVNGTLRDEELAFVEQHVAVCERCQREAEWLHELFTAYADIAELQNAPAEGSAVASLARPIRAGHWRARVSSGWRNAQPWVRGLLAAQLAAIAVLGGLLAIDTRNEATYHALGASSRSAQARNAIAVVFDPSITEAELRRVVHAVGARIVDGPTSTNAFVLEVPATQLDHAMQALRTERTVRFAERLGPEIAP
jgi:anti-sigma-K factor RskA